MAKEPRGRELKKPAQPLPELPYSLGRLRMPRKTNRKAAKLIESGVKLWDRRYADRRARQRGIENAEGQERNRRYRRLQNDYLRNLLKVARGWQFMDRQGAIEPDLRVEMSFEERIDSLIAAAKIVPFRNPEDEEVYFRVAGLTWPEHMDLRAVLPEGLVSTYSYSDRSIELGDGRYFMRLNRYDPRVDGPFTDDDGVVHGTGVHDSSSRDSKGRLVSR